MLHHTTRKENGESNSQLTSTAIESETSNSTALSNVSLKTRAPDRIELVGDSILRHSGRKNIKKANDPSGDWTKIDKSRNNNARSVICLFNNLQHFDKKAAVQTCSSTETATNCNQNALEAQPQFDAFLVPSFRKLQLAKSSEKSAQVTQDDEKVGEINQTNETRFPFRSTSSGNLKINANQVVYETNRISVLVADPKRTQVKISNQKNCCETDVGAVDMQKEDFTRNSTINAIMNQGLGSSIGSLLMGRITDAPVRKEKESSEYETKATHEILEPELNLSRLGYTSTDCIDWNEIILPEKKNLYLELFNRITNFTNADCKVYIDNEEFSCHLLVLQCYSEVFHTYVAVKKVELPSDKCSPASFAFIYQWMITGDPSYRDLTREVVLDIFNAAKYMKIKDLVEQCWAFIDNPKVFSEDTAFLLYIDAKEKNLPEVRDLMLPRIERFFLMLVSSEDWLRLDVEDVCAFLQSNYICVNCEMEVFMSAVRWLKHDWENRDKYKHQILSCVRFGNIAPWQLVDIKRNPDNPEFRDLAKEPEICKMIDDGLAFVIIKYWYGQENDDYQHWNSILALKEPPVRNWSGTEKTYFTYREFLIYLDVYRRNLMIVKSSRRADEKYLINEVHLTAGESSDKVENAMKMPTMEEFMRGSSSKNASRKQWLHHRNLNSHHRMSRKRAVAIIQRAYLHYKLMTRIKGLAKRIKYDVRRQQMSSRREKRLSSMKSSPRCDELGEFRKNNVLGEGSLYHVEHESVLVFGGINVHSKYGTGRNTGKDIYRYLPVRNNWEFVGELPAPRTHHCVAYMHGRIYVVGGSDPREDDVKGKFLVVDSVWSFDPVTRIWFREGCLNMRRKNFGLVVSGKYMYAIGGQDRNSRVTDTVERYNPAKGCWDYMAPMRHPRMGVACTKFDDKIWVGGGMCGSSQKPLTDYVECYDVQTNQWTEVARLRLPRCFATFCAMSNNLYLIAGAGRSKSLVNTVSFSSVDILNKETNRWEEHAKMEVARHGHTTAYLGTQILIIGGVTTVYMRSLSSIECFCTTRGTWIRGMCSLPNCLTGHATCTLPPVAMI